MSKYQKDQQLPQAEQREELTSTLLLFKAIERTNQTVLSNGDNFDQCVDIVFQMTPQRVKNAIVEKQDTYKKEREEVSYDYWCGVKQTNSKKVFTTEYIDYRALYNVILNELENAGIHFRTQSLTYQIGNADEKEVRIPLQTLEVIRSFLNKAIEGDVATGEKYSLYDLLQRLMPPVPETPIFIEDAVAESDQV